MPQAFTPSTPAPEQPLPPPRARIALPPPAIEPVGASMVNAMRVILAAAALMVMNVAPFASERLTTLTYASLIAYCAYSVLLYAIGRREQTLPSGRINHWADVFFYAYLVALTGGASSVFFFFFFFPILVSSFSGGFREGLFVTVASVALFVLVGFTVPSAGLQSQFGELAIRPVYLSTLGYMLAYWGGYEMMLKRRMTLLNEVNNLWNPRFGVDHTIGINLDRLLHYHHRANSCVLLLKRPTAPATYLLYSASAHRPGRLALPSMIPETTARKLLRLPEAYAATYHDPNGGSWFRRGVRLAGYDLESRNRNGAPLESCREIATLLDTRTFVTAPYSERDGTVGRLFVASEGKPFEHSDIEFLAQFAATISPVIESMHLMEELVSRATEDERFKISRDIHDTTIQPYIGLKLGLDALYREAGEDGPHSRRIGELIEMANLTIRDLRAYAATLREGSPLPGDFLVSAVQRQAERLERFYGIDVEVKSDINGHLSSRLAAEAFQIVSEGLSNILRHTQARHAYAHILCEEENLLLKVGNEEARPAAEVPDFTPRSIYERVESLGGETVVEKGVDGFTVVHVNIPI